MNVETKTHEIANRRARLNEMDVNDLTVHRIEKVLQGAILGKGKAEQAVRLAILPDPDLDVARLSMLSSLKMNAEITNENLDSVNTDDLGRIIGTQMRAVALSKKEKGAEDENSTRLTLRTEVIKDDGFCKKVYEYTQDPVNKERVGEALQLLAADLDQRRLDAKVELHNETLTEGHLNAIILNRDLVNIKDERDQAEVGEEIPVLNDNQKERVREHVATKRLLEEEQLEKIQKEIDSKSEAKEKEIDDVIPDEDKPDKFSIIKFFGKLFHRSDSHVVATETPASEPEPVIHAIVPDSLRKTVEGLTIKGELKLRGIAYNVNGEVAGGSELIANKAKPISDCLNPDVLFVLPLMTYTRKADNTQEEALHLVGFHNGNRYMLIIDGNDFDLKFLRNVNDDGKTKPQLDIINAITEIHHTNSLGATGITHSSYLVYNNFCTIDGLNDLMTDIQNKRIGKEHFVDNSTIVHTR